MAGRQSTAQRENSEGVFSEITAKTVAQVASAQGHLTEIRDLLTVYDADAASGKQNKSFISGLDRGRSRHPERLFGRPDMFVIPTPRARSNEHSFVMIFGEMNRSKATVSNGSFILAIPKLSQIL